MSAPVHPVRTQARAIIERGGQIALVRSCIDNWEFWVLPGGGQVAGEDLRSTVARECREELAVDVTVGHLRIVREYIPGAHPDLAAIKPTQCIDFIFECSLPRDQDIAVGPALESESTGVAWWALADLADINLYPDALKTWFAGAGLGGTGITYLGNTR